MHGAYTFFYHLDDGTRFHHTTYFLGTVRGAIAL